MYAWSRVETGRGASLTRRATLLTAVVSGTVAITIEVGVLAQVGLVRSGPLLVLPGLGDNYVLVGVVVVAGFAAAGALAAAHLATAAGAAVGAPGRPRRPGGVRALAQAGGRKCRQDVVPASPRLTPGTAWWYALAVSVALTLVSAAKPSLRSSLAVAGSVLSVLLVLAGSLLHRPRTRLWVWLALVRRRHPKHGLPSPGVLLGVVSSSGQDRQLDRVVPETVLDQLARWREEGLALVRVSVNLTSDSLADPDLATAALEALHRAGVPPSLLTLTAERFALDVLAPRALEPSQVPAALTCR